MVASQPKFVCRAVHAAALDTAKLRLLDGHAVGQRGADKRDRHLVAGLEVLRAAHDLQRLGRADVDARHPQLVGLGMALLGNDLADHHAFKRGAGNVDALDRCSGQVEPIDQFLDRQINGRRVP